MRAPPGFRGDDGGDNVIWKLKSAVNSLKQASSCFWTVVHSHLIKINFSFIDMGSMLIPKESGGGKKMLVCCYVDILLPVLLKSKEIGDVFLVDMRKRFFIGEGLR
jgi:hypothetical protein